MIEFGQKITALGRSLRDMMMPGQEDPVAPPQHYVSVQVNDYLYENRQQRRSKKNDPEAQNGTRWLGVLKNTCNQLNHHGLRWEEIVLENDRRFAKIIYQGEPMAAEWLNHLRGLPATLERMHFANLEQPFTDPSFLNRLDEADVFSVKSGNTSLLDVEQMNLDRGSFPALSREDIGRIDGIFRMHILANPNPAQIGAREAMIYLATQKLARVTEKINYPDSLNPLYERLVAYFDHYTYLMTNRSPDHEEDTYLLMRLADLPIPAKRLYLAHALGCYIPARLGITPSSAIKLYRERARNSWYSTRQWQKRILRPMELETENAFRKNNLPVDLQPYQNFDEQMDQLAGKQLANYYAQMGLSDEELVSEYEESEQMVARLARYRKVINSDLYHLPDRRWVLAMPDSHVVSNVVVTNQNREGLIVIMQCRDGRTHLTLDIAPSFNGQKEGLTFYGFPKEFYGENPHGESLVFNDILRPLLEKAKAKFPDIEPFSGKPSHDFGEVLIAEPPANEVSISTEEARSLFTAQVKVRDLPKRQVPLTPIQQYFARISEVPELQKAPERQFIVTHSRIRVIELLGTGKRTPKKDVDRIMEEIKDFEFGKSDPKRILQGIDTNLRELQAGRFRIILKHRQDRFYSVVAVGDRKEIFRKYQISPSTV